MNARLLIEMAGKEDPKKILRAHPEQGLGYKERPIDRSKDWAWNFYFGTPISMQFTVIARDKNEAIDLANAYLYRLVGNDGYYLGDDNDTQFLIGERSRGYRLGWKQVFMYWPLDEANDTEDALINDDWEG